MADPEVAAQQNAPHPPRVTPSASQDIRVDWGSWIAQAAAHEEPILVAAAEAGIKVGLSQVPMGFLIEGFLGPKIVEQYIDMGIKALGGVIGSGTVDIPGGTVFATVANLINANEPAFAAFVEGKLDPMIKAGLAKLNINV